VRADGTGEPVTLEALEQCPRAKERICNGIGPASLQARVPAWLWRGWQHLQIVRWFRVAGNRHDAGYFAGGDRRRKIECDWRLLNDMLAEAWAKERYRHRAGHIALAFVFFFAVLFFGGPSFNWTEHPRDMAYVREWEAELEQEEVARLLGELRAETESQGI
jgi:hypothetical protein